MDKLTKAIAYNNTIRIYAAITTNLVGEAQRLHDLWPSSSVALGRTMTASLLTSALKDENLTVKINGNGPIGDIMVEALKNGTARGYCGDPHQFYQYNSTGKINASYAVGTDGELSISHIVNNELFTSSSPLQTGEIGEDFTYYFAYSEQIPSSVSLGVMVNEDNTIKAAGGFIVQVLPGCPEAVIDLLEARLKETKEISKMVDLNYTPEDIIKEVIGSDYKILEELPLSWKCRCSRERFKNALLMLDEKDLAETNGEIETVCHYCNTRYVFNKEDLKK